MSDQYFGFKRVDLAGVLLSELFREYYQMFLSKVTRVIDEQYNYNKNIYQGYQADGVTPKFNSIIKFEKQKNFSKMIEP